MFQKEFQVVRAVSKKIEGVSGKFRVQGSFRGISEFSNNSKQVKRGIQLFPKFFVTVSRKSHESKKRVSKVFQMKFQKRFMQVYRLFMGVSQDLGGVFN